jgi:8-amino-7-oxononanoate synthase
MNTSPIYDRINRALTRRREQDLFRSIHFTDVKTPIDLSTNSYLALNAEPQIIHHALELTKENLCGNLASRLVMESSPLYTVLESELASWEHTESALVFSSGYAANVGIIQAICTKDTEVFCDRLNHASIYDGIALSGCRLNRYRHIDMSDLRDRLSASIAKEKIIITDTVFSMDGDRAPLNDICELAKKFNCLVMVDEAHATGIFGATGTGLVEETATSDSIDIRMGTLSKALAGLGGYFAGSTLLRDYFVNFSRSLIYSTGLPHATLAFTIAAIRFIRKHPDHGRTLLERADNFRQRVKRAGYTTFDSTTQIIPCLLNSKDEALQMSAFLKSVGISAPAIRPPTVPEGTARIRFSYNLGLSNADEDFIIDQLVNWKKKNA